jgi:hypothetical protein
MNKSNYDLVLRVFKSYEMDIVLEDFKNSFVEGENISRKDYVIFCSKYVDDAGEGYYIDLNWKFIESGGDLELINRLDSGDDSWRDEFNDE